MPLVLAVKLDNVPLAEAVMVVVVILLKLIPAGVSMKVYFGAE